MLNTSIASSGKGARKLAMTRRLLVDAERENEEMPMAESLKSIVMMIGL